MLKVSSKRKYNLKSIKKKGKLKNTLRKTEKSHLQVRKKLMANRSVRADT